MSNKRIFSLGVAILFVVGLATNSIEFVFPEQAALPVYDNDSSELSSFSADLSVSPYAGDKFLLDALSSATTSIDIQTYDFTNKDIKALLQTKLDQGVMVRLMMEDRKYKQFRDSYTEIASLYFGYENFMIQSDRNLDTRYIHSKYIIVDNKTALVQSANLTHSAFTNREHFLVVYDSGFIKGLSTVFEADWAGDPVRQGAIHPNIMLCPIDCRDDVMRLLKSTQESLWIQTQYISDPAITKLLQSIVGHVDTKIVVADTDESMKFIEYFGPAIVRPLKKPYVHTKTMLIDDRILMIGSINFSTNSLDNNRELAILITDPDAIQIYKKYFLQDWEKSL